MSKPETDRTIRVINLIDVENVEHQIDFPSTLDIHGARHSTVSGLTTSKDPITSLHPAPCQAGNRPAACCPDGDHSETSIWQLIYGTGSGIAKTRDDIMQQNGEAQGRNASEQLPNTQTKLQQKKKTTAVKSAPCPPTKIARLAKSEATKAEDGW